MTARKMLLGLGSPFSQTRVDFNRLHGTDSSSGTNPFTSPANLNDGNPATHADRAATSTTTVSIVQKATAASGVGNMNLDFPNPVTAGNLLFMVNSRRNSGPVFAFFVGTTAGPSRPFTGISPQVSITPTLGFEQFGYRIATGDEQHIVASNDQAVATVYELADAGTASLFEILSATQQGAGVARDLGAFTTPGGLQIAGFITNSSATDQTAGSGYAADFQSITNGFLPPDFLAEHSTTAAHPASTGTAYGWAGLAAGVTTSHADTTSICQADLGMAYPVNRITLLEAAATGTHYAISWSNDGSSWTTISPTFSAVGALQTYDLAATVAARYWRITDNHSPSVALTGLTWDTWTIEGFPF